MSLVVYWGWFSGICMGVPAFCMRCRYSFLYIFCPLGRILPMVVRLFLGCPCWFLYEVDS